MNKRGVAPLFATVILVTIAVALGIIVMNFGRAQIEISARCAIDIDLRPLVLAGQEQICFDRENSTIRFALENGAIIPVKGLRVRIIGDNDIISLQINEMIDLDGVFFGELDYSVKSYGEILQFKATPAINLYNEEIVCPQRAVILEQVRDC